MKTLTQDEIEFIIECIQTSQGPHETSEWDDMAESVIDKIH